MLDCVPVPLILSRYFAPVASVLCSIAVVAVVVDVLSIVNQSVDVPLLVFDLSRYTFTLCVPERDAREIEMS